MNKLDESVSKILYVYIRITTNVLVRCKQYYMCYSLYKKDKSGDMQFKITVNALTIYRATLYLHHLL